MADRLSRALDTGAVALPGPVLVLGATAESDLSALDPAATRIDARFADAHAAQARDGWSVAPDVGSHDAESPTADSDVASVLVFAPRSRDAQRMLIRQARAATDGPIVVDGPKTHGIDALWRDLRQRADTSDAFAKAHGKTFTVAGGRFDDWPDRIATKGADGWWRVPGTFSADHVDPGSAALAEALPASLSGRGADLGAGWGYLSRAVLERDGVAALHMVENDAWALQGLRRNVDDPRATAHWADALTWRADAPLDFVVTNPPFHGAGRAADPALGRAFITAAAGLLSPKGALWLVANRHLPYESALSDAFAETDEIGGTSAFKILRGQRPKRRGRG